MLGNSKSSRHIVSNTHVLKTTRPVSSNLAEVSFVCERSFILLSHTPQGGTFSTGSVPVFAGSPHKAPGTPQKLAFLRAVAIICCYTSPPPPTPKAFVCFSVRPPVPPAVFIFVGEGHVWARFLALCVFKNHKISLCFDTFYITKRETDVPVVIAGFFC